MPIEPADLRSLRNLEATVSLFRGLGYAATPRAIDSNALRIGDYPRNALLREGKLRREGYAVWIVETTELPRSLTAFARSLVEFLHDFPLGVLGVRGPTGQWERVVILRPRVVAASGGPAYRAAKIEVLVDSPTLHDAEVVEMLRWVPGNDSQTQERIEKAFDVETVTARFFVGLRDHFDAIHDALEAARQRQPHVAAALDQAGGPRRVAIRLVSQALFCWFLQRRGFLAGDRDYLLSRWRTHKGNFYNTELEPLFYDTLAMPVPAHSAGRPGPEIPLAGAPPLPRGTARHHEAAVGRASLCRRAWLRWHLSRPSPVGARAPSQEASMLEGGR